MLNRLWYEPDVYHMVAELSWNFSEYLFCKISLGHGLVESHKLHDVAHTRSAAIISKTTTVTIKLVHATKVSIANTDDND